MLFRRHQVSQNQQTNPTSSWLSVKSEASGLHVATPQQRFTFTLYMFIHPSPPPVPSQRPSGLNVRAYTGRRWSASIFKHVPVIESHNRTVQSNDALQGDQFSKGQQNGWARH